MPFSMDQNNEIHKKKSPCFLLRYQPHLTNPTSPSPATLRKQRTQTSDKPNKKRRKKEKPQLFPSNKLTATHFQKGKGFFSYYFYFPYILHTIPFHHKTLNPHSPIQFNPSLPMFFSFSLHPNSTISSDVTPQELRARPLVPQEEEVVEAL